MPPKQPRKPRPLSRLAPRFGIGEWYGQPVQFLTPDERRATADRALLHDPKKPETCPVCPFQTETAGKPVPCHKRGGVCTLRLYKGNDDGSCLPVPDETGVLRTVCPARFAQGKTAFDWVGERILKTDNPHVIGEVRFLKRPPLDAEDREQEAEQSKKHVREDVGNIDNVLIASGSDPLAWCALEIQAVYFSGERMSDLFEHLRDWKGEGIRFPDRQRAPDYRSSGPKRLMPQLQIKVPALRRWGKKMAVVVDRMFFKKLGYMEPVPDPDDVSNSDIAWFVVDFDESTRPFTLRPGLIHLTTLERAVEGLTNGIPVSLSTFESRIREKLSAPPDEALLLPLE